MKSPNIVVTAMKLIISALIDSGRKIVTRQLAIAAIIVAFMATLVVDLSTHNRVINKISEYEWLNFWLLELAEGTALQKLSSCGEAGSGCEDWTLQEHFEIALEGVRPKDHGISSDLVYFTLAGTWALRVEDIGLQFLGREFYSIIAINEELITTEESKVRKLFNLGFTVVESTTLIWGDYAAVDFIIIKD